LGSVNMGKDKTLGQTILDQRNQTGTILSYQTHMMTAKNLSPQTLYYFAIESGTGTYLSNGQPYQVTTAPQISATPSATAPLSGKIELPDGSAATGALVYVDEQNSQSLSTLSKNDGSFSVPLADLRTKDLASYSALLTTSILHIQILGSNLASNILFSLTSDNILPLVTLSNNYDFTAQTSFEPSASSSAGGFATFLVGGKTQTATAPKITSPKNAGTVIDPQPVFRGTAMPNQTVVIIIHSTPIQAQVTSDANGNWSFRPSTPLPVGNHTITITTKDSLGILRTITQSFTVFAAGTQVFQTATPSATPTIAAVTAAPTILTPTPTNVAVITLTPIPTVLVTPTPTPTLIAATPFPTVILTPTPTPQQVIPPTGDASVLIAGAAGATTTVIGILLFLLSRGGALL
ncbi:MAG TPA: Ig-like domain-containing protein, partial [Candidatus Saccharimonadales bacterium]|nr:Ig-like domain-containing protein [Candidatus Saccharimonadales bacterium]